MCQELCRLIVALTSLAENLSELIRHEIPLSPPRKSALGTTITLEEDDAMSTMKYKQILGPLPEKLGKNKDIVAAVLRVDLDGAEGAPFDVTDFDLDTRQYTGDGVPWDAKKGSDVSLGLAYKDDDGNVSPFTFVPFGIAKDTIAPDAPTIQGLGSTAVLDEVENLPEPGGPPAPVEDVPPPAVQDAGGTT